MIAVADLEFSKSGATPQPSLEAGLAALRRKDFGAAIAHLAPLSQHHADRAVRRKARMGLVLAYEQAGQLDQAIALCQALQGSSSAPVRQWSAQMLAEFARRYSAPAGQAASPVEPQPENRSETMPAAADDDLSAYLNGVRLRGQVPAAAKQANAAKPPSTALIPQDSARSNPALLWRQAERAARWTPIKPLDRALLWGLAAGSLVLLAILLRYVLVLPITLFNALLLGLLGLVDLRSLYIYQDPLVFVLPLLLVSFLLLPWLMTEILRRFYRMQSFSLEALERYSPEAAQLLRQFFEQHHCPLPTLRRIPSSAPLVLTWGIIPQKTTLVFSQGLLQQLAADELAALVAAELGHIEHLDFIPLSVLALVTQLPYLGYRQLSDWGDALLQSAFRQQRQDKASQAIALVGSGLCYGLYRLLRVPGLGLSRLRLYYSDRTAANQTGNPNALIRALLKLTLGIAHDIETRQFTDPLLESFDLLLPVSPRAALTLGSLEGQPLNPILFQWDLSSPYRFWLALNNTHPLLGDRLLHLVEYARQWQLEPELELERSPVPQTQPHRQPQGAKFRTSVRTHPLPAPRSTALLATPPLPPRSALFPPLSRDFLLQLAPVLGLLCGGAMALLMGQVGTLATQLKWYEIDWMNDKSVFWGVLLIAVGVGMLVRINRLFPDCQPSNTRVNLALSDLITAAIPLPIDSQPVQLQGTLLGRTGLSNRFNQDLLLRCESGSIRLHYVPKLGPWISLVAEVAQPNRLLQRSVVVTGWFRRGATPWIDVERIQPARGQGQIIGGAPTWSTLMAIATTLAGVYVIFAGGR